jgi:hypothetical protein
MTSENPEIPSGENPKPEATRKPYTQANDPKNQVPFAAALSQETPASHHCNIKRDWVDVGTIILEGFGLFVLVVYALATIAIWCANKKAADAAKEAANAAQTATAIASKQLDLSERPWIAPRFVPSYLMFRQDGALLGLRITVTNIGHSVAESISVWTELYFESKTLLSEGKRYCDIPKNATNKDYRGGFLLFPGEPRSLEQPAIATEESVKEALTNGDLKNSHMIEAHLITCIDYRSSIDSEHHQTIRYFLLGRPDHLHNRVIGGFDPHERYAASQILIFPEGWDTAD